MINIEYVINAMDSPGDIKGARKEMLSSCLPPLGYEIILEIPQSESEPALVRFKILTTPEAPCFDPEKAEATIELAPSEYKNSDGSWPDETVLGGYRAFHEDMVALSKKGWELIMQSECSSEAFLKASQQKPN